MNRFAPRLTMLAMAAVFAACSASANTKQAEAAVQQFHDLLDDGKSTAIYESAGDDLKRVSSEQQFVPLLDAVHRKLGQTKTATRSGWNVNYSTSGNFITLNYQTVYAEGDASEQFVYRMVGDKPILVGYHINSNALILK
jgi:hypothetical protein